MKQKMRHSILRIGEWMGSRELLSYHVLKLVSYFLQLLEAYVVVVAFECSPSFEAVLLAKQLTVIWSLKMIVVAEWEHWSRSLYRFLPSHGQPMLPLCYFHHLCKRNSPYYCSMRLNSLNHGTNCSSQFGPYSRGSCSGCWKDGRSRSIRSLDHRLPLCWFLLILQLLSHTFQGCVKKYQPTLTYSPHQRLMMIDLRQHYLAVSRNLMAPMLDWWRRNCLLEFVRLNSTLDESCFANQYLQFNCSMNADFWCFHLQFDSKLRCFEWHALSLTCLILVLGLHLELQLMSCYFLLQLCELFQ